MLGAGTVSVAAAFSLAVYYLPPEPLGQVLAEAPPSPSPSALPPSPGPGPGGAVPGSPPDIYVSPDGSDANTSPRSPIR